LEGTFPEGAQEAVKLRNMQEKRTVRRDKYVFRGYK
jgi:hypothetical protein